MVTQRVISFKIDSDLLESLDDFIGNSDDIRLNRNKFINYALNFVLSVAKLQKEINPRNISNILSNY